MPAKTVLFKSNQTQAVRLPKDVAFPEGVQEVEIIKVGNSRIICPVGHRWDSFFADPDKISDDFLTERDQGTFEPREPMECCVTCSTPTRVSTPCARTEPLTWQDGLAAIPTNSVSPALSWPNYTLAPRTRSMCQPITRA